MKYAARALGLATLAVAALAASSVAHAQPAACQDSVELPPWTPGVTSNFVDGGATGDESAGYTICSSAPGPSDPYDSYRLLTQPAGGDFELEATVESLSAGGAGGLVATVLGLDLLTAARVLIWVETDTDDPSIAWLRSSIRREDDGASEPEPAPIMVTLPLRLHLARTGGVLSAGFRVDGILTDHLVADITGEQLDVALRVGMQQFSGEPDVTHFAVFQRPSLVAARVPEVDCIEGSPFASGALHVSGKNLDSVTAISAFGGPVVLLAQSPERLILQPAAPPAGGVNYGQLELGHAASRLPLRVDIASIGTPLIRGDVDMDGDVDLDDFRDLRRWMNRGVEPACPGAGDVNGDTFTNQTDVDALKAWLKGTGHAPAAPFPAPGFVQGAFTCGAPAAPDIRRARVLRANRDRPVIEGDIVKIIGQNLPPASDLVIWFGDVPTRMLGGDSHIIKVLVGEVPTSGPRCARVIHVQAQHPGSGLRVGGGWLADLDAPKLCLDFTATAAPTPGFRAVTATDGTLEIPVPSADWKAGQAYDIDATVFMPWLDGQSRGSRALKMLFRSPDAPSTTAGGVSVAQGDIDGYTTGLNALAAAMTTQFNGGYLPSTPSTPCECEVEVIPVPALEKLILAPCIPPPPKPEPAVPGPDKLKKPNPIIVGGISITPKSLPAVECDGELISYKTNPRKFAWCHFRDIVQPMDANTYPETDPFYLGHPLFASWKPVATVRQALIGEDGGKWTLNPDAQPLNEKHVLFEYRAVDQLKAMDYGNPYVWALRRKHCQIFAGEWMPKIGLGNRIAKTFYVPESRLPASVDPDSLYSYVPPGKQRHYLVGLHLANSTLHDFGNSFGYYSWSTFWIPPGPGDTKTRGGAPLASSYDPKCVIGTGQDRPAGLPPFFDNFVMCTDSAPGERGCGNPYADTFPECDYVPDPQDPEQTDTPVTTCTGCHAAMGRVVFNTPGAVEGTVELGWLPSLKMDISGADLTAIAHYVTDNPQKFTWWTEPKINEGTDLEEPLSCAKSAKTVWNPFDPDAEFGDGEPF